MKRQLILTTMFSTFVAAKSLAYNFNNIQYKIPGLSQTNLKLNNEEFKNACLDYQKRMEMNSTLLQECLSDGVGSLACMKIESIRTSEKASLGDAKKFIFSVQLDQGLEPQINQIEKHDFLSFAINKIDYEAENAVFKKVIYQSDSETKKMIDLGLNIYPAKMELGNTGPALTIYSRELACDLYNQKMSLEFEAPVTVILNNNEIKTKSSLLINLQKKLQEKMDYTPSVIQSTVSATTRMYAYLQKQNYFNINQSEIEPLIHQLFPIIFQNENLEFRKQLSNSELQKFIPNDVIKYEKVQIILH